MNTFRSLRDYEEFIYTLQQRFPSVRNSTMLLIPRGKRVAILKGQLIFDSGYRLTVQERLSFDSDVLVIESYGYELWHNSDKIAWYDSQPHPHDPSLASSHPHHKHIPPDIKHNRIPAPMLSFTRPNLPVLIREIDDIISSTGSQKEGV